MSRLFQLFSLSQQYQTYFFVDSIRNADYVDLTTCVIYVNASSDVDAKKDSTSKRHQHKSLLKKHHDVVDVSSKTVMIYASKNDFLEAGMHSCVCMAQTTNFLLFSNIGYVDFVNYLV